MKGWWMKVQFKAPIFMALGLMLAIHPACAEFRIWTDNKGNEIEAELVGRFGGKITLRDRNGRVMKIDPSGLSEADQLYLDPPPSLSDLVEIRLIKRSWGSKPEEVALRSNAAYTTDWEFSMAVKTKDRDVPELEGARGFVFIVGRPIGQRAADEEFVVIQTFEADFEWQGKIGMASAGRVRTEYVKGDKGRPAAGVNYEGFFIALISKEGEVLLTQSSDGSFDHIEKLRLLSKNDRFNKKLEKSEK